MDFESPIYLTKDNNSLMMVLVINCLNYTLQDSNNQGVFYGKSHFTF